MHFDVRPHGPTAVRLTHGTMIGVFIVCLSVCLFNSSRSGLNAQAAPQLAIIAEPSVFYIRPHGFDCPVIPPRLNR